MTLTLPSIPAKRKKNVEPGLKLSKEQRQTSLYDIDDADLKAMIAASGQSPSFIIRELVHEMMQQLRAGDGTDVKLNRSVLLAQERVTRNGTQPLVAKLEVVRTEVSDSLASFREVANRIDGRFDTVEDRLARLEEQGARQTAGMSRVTEACAVVVGILRHYVLFYFARNLTEQERAEGRSAPNFDKLESGFLRWCERLRERGAQGDPLGEIRFKDTVAQTADAVRELTAPLAPPTGTPAQPGAAASTPPSATSVTLPAVPRTAPDAPPPTAAPPRPSRFS